MNNQCAIFQLPGVGPLTVFPDIMHVKHMGTDAWFYGSASHVLVFEVFAFAPMEIPGNPRSTLGVTRYRSLVMYARRASGAPRYSHVFGGG